jgi:5-methylcytosine-specific restriction endonuclease McrA
LNKAISAGLKHYFTGKPCKQGHICERRVKGNRCLECDRTRARDYARAHTAEAKARAAAWYAANRDYQIVQSRRWALAHAERVRTNAERWRAENLEHMRATMSAYQKANRELCRAISRNYVARKRGATGSHTPADIESFYAEQDGRCAYCMEPLTARAHVDHIIPLIQGGSNDPSNLCLACPTCNQGKGGRTGPEFLMRRELSG